MKINENFVLRQVAENWVVLSLAEKTINFNGMLTLNDTGALIWQALEQGRSLDEIVGLLTAEYAISEEEARSDAVEFIEKLSRVGCIDRE